MATVDFNVEFRLDRDTPSIALRLTDASSLEGASVVKGNFQVTYGDGYVNGNSDYTNPDITAESGSKDYALRLDSSNSPVTGTYTILYTVIHDSNQNSVSKTFSFSWSEPSVIITNETDVTLPEVKFSDGTTLDDGNFSEAISRSWSIPYPTTSNENGNTEVATTSEIDVQNDSFEYFEGSYNVSLTHAVTYTHNTYSYLSVYWKKVTSQVFDIRKTRSQAGLISLIKDHIINNIDLYDDKNDARYIENMATLARAMSLYTHLIDRVAADLQDGTEDIYNDLLEIIENSSSSYTYQAGPISGLELIILSNISNEQIDDRVNTLLQGGTGVSLDYNDTDNTLTINAAFSTDEISEGSTNLYFTNERVMDVVASLAVAGSDISISYDDEGNTLTFSLDLSGVDTDDIEEGSTNLYHTNERVMDAMAGSVLAGTNMQITYDDPANTLTFDVDLFGMTPSVGTDRINVPNGSGGWSITRLLHDYDSNLNSTLLTLNSSDASDDQRLVLSGGGAGSQSRGAGIILYGNEWNPELNVSGDCAVLLGDVGDSEFRVLGASASTKFSVKDDGTVTIAGAYSLPTTDGSAGQIPQTNGSGVVSWASLGAPATTTPTLTGVSNVTSITGGSTYYRDYGTHVSFEMKCTVTPTSSATTTSARISIPVASNLAINDIIATGSAFSSTTTPVFVIADAANDEVQVQFTSINTTGHTVQIVGSYPVI